MRKFLVEFFTLILCCGLTGQARTDPAVPAAHSMKSERAHRNPARPSGRFLKLPLIFEANRGQSDNRVKFLSRGPGYVLFLTSSEAVLALHLNESGAKTGMDQSEAPGNAATAGRFLPAPRSAPASGVVRVGLVGADPAARVEGLDELPGKSSYFIGDDPKKWQSGIPNFARVRYRSVYPGVDLIFYGNPGQVECDFVVSPGADPRKINLGLEGMAPAERGFRITPEGDLLLRAEGGEVRFRRPVVYQDTAASGAGTAQSRHYIDARYVLSGRDRIGFEIAAYDTRRPLVIDPVLSYSTYLGGTNADVGDGIAVDASLNVYVTGSTSSSDFPTATPLQASNLGVSNVFISKLDPTGTTLVYSTYLGGSGFDRSAGIAIDSAGNAYVAGYTSSTNFPTTKGAVQEAYGGGSDDAFLVKLNPTGSALVYSTYLGGSGADFGFGLAVDSSGNGYVTGTTASSDFPLVTPLPAPNNALQGSSDAFVAVVNGSGSGLVYSTYLGGSAADTGQGIAVDAVGNAYVTGFTYSADFTTTSGAFQTICSSIVPGPPQSCAFTDVFITKLDPTGTALVYSTYLGGSGLNRAFSVAVDSSGNAYVTGDTKSSSFPTTPGAPQTVNNGLADAFVTKLNPAGSSLVYSTYLGGSRIDGGVGIAVDSSGSAYVTGLTQSANFPLQTPVQASFGGGTCSGSPCPDAFVAKLDPLTGALVYSTYLGGSGADFGQAIAVAVDSSGKAFAFITGGTQSSNFPATAGVFQTVVSGAALAGDAFVAKIDPTAAPGVALSVQKLTFESQGTGTTSPAQTVTLTNVGSSALTFSSITITGTDSVDFAEADNCASTSPIAAAGGTCSVNVTFTPTITGAKTASVDIPDDAASSPQHVALTGTGATPAPAVTFSPTTLTFTNQTFGTTSAPQTVALTNSGSAQLDITKIAITGDFAETDICIPPGSTTGGTLAAGASCSFSITFTPTASGSRTGLLTVTDSATGSPHSVSLSGTGDAVFSLIADKSSVTITIGTSSTTFMISASGPTNFTDKINVTCASGATCSFNPASITVGQSSTMTVSGLSGSTANPFNFNVNGASGSQTFSAPLKIVLADFSVSASPLLALIAAGDSATYTISVAPSNGFNEAVSFSCNGTSGVLPQGVTCSVSPTSVTPDGTSAATATLTVKTTAPSRVWPGGPWRERPWDYVTILGMLWLLALAAAIAHGTRRRGQRAPARRLALGTLVLLTLLWVACGNYIPPSVQTTGLGPGNYTLTVTGTHTAGSNNVTRTTTVNLSVS